MNKYNAPCGVNNDVQRPGSKREREQISAREEINLMESVENVCKNEVRMICLHFIFAEDISHLILDITTMQDKLNQLAVRLQYQMRSLVPLQMELIEQQQELYDRAVAIFDGVVEDKSEQDLFNILMGVANMQIPYSFTVHDIVQYNLIFSAAIELAQGSYPAAKKKKRSLRRDDFYQTYLRPTVQCAWNCALASLGCHSAELRDIVGMHAVMVMDQTSDSERRTPIQAVKFRHTTFLDLYNCLCNFVSHCRVKNQSRIYTTFPKWQEFERVIVPDQEGGEQQSECSEYTREKIAEEEEEGDDVEEEAKRAPSSGGASDAGGNINNDMQLVVADNNEAGTSYADDAHGSNVNVNDHNTTLQDCSADSGNDHTLTTVDNDDNITMQGSVAPEEGLFNSAAILSEISLLTREEVESKMREYGADGLDDCDRNFDHLINILSTPRTSMVDSSKRLSLTRADWTILRNSTLFCSMFFSTLMRQVSHFPRFLSFSNVFGFTHLNIMYSIGNPQLGLSTRCPRELPTTRCSVWHYTSRQQLQ